MVHWLQVGGRYYSLEREQKQWVNIGQYIKNYPNSKVTVFVKNTGDLFARIVKLECDQNYNDLELDCNSGFDSSLKRLDRKPQDIEICNHQFEYFINRIIGGKNNG